MPGNATIGEAPGQPLINTDSDFSMCIVGYTATSAVASGKVSPVYSNASAAQQDVGGGDAFDVLAQAITVTPGNPAPPPCAIYSTLATSPGTYVAAAVVSGVTGTAVPANNAAVPPKGTYEPWMQIVSGFTIGITGGTAYASLNNGRNKTLVQIGTSDAYNFPASDGWGISNRAGFLFSPGSTDLTALNTLINEEKTDFNAHVILTTGTVHTNADSGNVVATANATNTATRIALINALRAAALLHFPKGTGGSPATHINVSGDAAGVTALSAVPIATDDESALTLALAFKAALNTHDAGTTWHTIVDATNTVTSPAPNAGTLNAGDVFYTATLAPMWGDTDLYTPASGPTDATGAFAAIAHTSAMFGKIVLTEPVAVADFSILVAGLNYGLSKGKRWSLIARFRDPQPAETDAAYILAFQTFVAACLDNRITYLAGSCWVSDAYTGLVYNRTFLAPYIARLASFFAVKGQEGERLAQNAGWVTRGVLEGATLKDANGNTIGHDEALRGGIAAANGAPIGGGVALYYQQIAARQGTYIDNRATVAYPPTSAILVPGDRAVANALETLAVGISLDAIGGADVIDRDATPPTLDEDIRTALAGSIAQEIRDNYEDEFQNAADPALVVIDAAVTITGAQVRLTGTLNVRFYDYTDTVALTFSATR